MFFMVSGDMIINPDKLYYFPPPPHDNLSNTAKLRVLVNIIFILDFQTLNITIYVNANIRKLMLCLILMLEPGINQLIYN